MRDPHFPPPPPPPPPPLLFSERDGVPNPAVVNAFLCLYDGVLFPPFAFLLLCGIVGTLLNSFFNYAALSPKDRVKIWAIGDETVVVRSASEAHVIPPKEELERSMWGKGGEEMKNIESLQGKANLRERGETETERSPLLLQDKSTSAKKHRNYGGTWPTDNDRTTDGQHPVSFHHQRGAASEGQRSMTRQHSSSGNDTACYYSHSSSTGGGAGGRERNDNGGTTPNADSLSKPSSSTAPSPPASRSITPQRRRNGGGGGKRYLGPVEIRGAVALLESHCSANNTGIGAQSDSDNDDVSPSAGVFGHSGGSGNDNSGLRLRPTTTTTIHHPRHNTDVETAVLQLFSNQQQEHQQHQTTAVVAAPSFIGNANEMEAVNARAKQQALREARESDRRGLLQWLIVSSNDTFFTAALVKALLLIVYFGYHFDHRGGLGRTAALGAAFFASNAISPAVLVALRLLLPLRLGTAGGGGGAAGAAGSAARALAMHHGSGRIGGAVHETIHTPSPPEETLYGDEGADNRFGNKEAPFGDGTAEMVSTCAHEDDKGSEHLNVGGRESQQRPDGAAMLRKRATRTRQSNPPSVGNNTSVLRRQHQHQYSSHGNSGGRYFDADDSASPGGAAEWITLDHLFTRSFDVEGLWNCFAHGATFVTVGCVLVPSLLIFVIAGWVRYVWLFAGPAALLFLSRRAHYAMLASPRPRPLLFDAIYLVLYRTAVTVGLVWALQSGFIYGSVHWWLPSETSGGNSSVSGKYFVYTYRRHDLDSSGDAAKMRVEELGGRHIAEGSFVGGKATPIAHLLLVGGDGGVTPLVASYGGLVEGSGRGNTTLSASGAGPKGSRGSAARPPTSSAKARTADQWAVGPIGASTYAMLPVAEARLRFDTSMSAYWTVMMSTPLGVVCAASQLLF